MSQLLRRASAALLVGSAITVFSSPALANDAQPTADEAETLLTLAGEAAAPAPGQIVLPATLERANTPYDSGKANAAEGGSGFTVSGEATLATDYRFRGVSQTDEDMAIQGGFTITHESGFYVGTWASNLSGWGTFGGSNTELDLIAGYSMPVGKGALDVGLVWYMYPGGADTTDFAEFYASLTGSVGPVELTGGVAYAPAQEALGNVFPTALDSLAGTNANVGDKEDNLYLYADAGVGIPDTPISFSAHIGYSDGNPGVGPNGTTLAPTGSYFDWSLGAAVEILSGLELSVAYIDTDIGARESAFLQPSFSVGNDGTGRIDDATIVASITASF